MPYALVAKVIIGTLVIAWIWYAIDELRARKHGIK